MAARGDNDKKTDKAKFKKKFKGKWKGAANKISTGSRDRGHAFVEARKRKALKEYKKLLRETREKRSTEPTTSESEQNLHPSQLDAKRRETLIPTHDADFQNPSEKEGLNSKRKRKNMTRYTTAETEFKKNKLERIQQIKEQEEERKKQAGLQKEKLKKRRQNFNRLNRRTQKGQPVMATQIEHLLQKIQT